MLFQSVSAHSREPCKNSLKACVVLLINHCVARCDLPAWRGRPEIPEAHRAQSHTICTHMNSYVHIIDRFRLDVPINFNCTKYNSIIMGILYRSIISIVYRRQTQQLTFTFFTHALSHQTQTHTKFRCHSRTCISWCVLCIVYSKRLWVI